MAVTPPKPKESAASAAQPSKAGSQDAFRQLLRQADKLIKDGNFEEATLRITEARGLDPGNPFIRAFEERLSIFKGKSSLEASPAPAPEKKPESHATKDRTPASGAEPSREMVEHHVRQELESEYKQRFTQELRKAEEHAAKLLQDERANIELHREALRTKFEHQLSEIKDQLERDYQRRLKAAAAQSEALLEKQYQESLTKAQQELAARLSANQRAEQKRLQEQILTEKASLESREQAATTEREQALRAEFERDLAEALKSSEKTIRAEGEEERRSGIEEAEKRLTAEFEARLTEETSRWQQRLDAEKLELLQAHEEQQRKLTEEQRQASESHEKTLHDRERQIREELSRQMEENLRQVRESVRGESDQERRSEVARREKKLVEEFESRLAAEQQKWKQELDSQRRQLESSYEDERSKLADLHRSEIEEHAKQRADLDEVRKHLTMEFETRLSADQERRTRDFDAHVRSLEQSHAEDRQKLADGVRRELEAAEAAFAERERKLRSDMERDSAEALREATEAVRGESDQRHKAELAELQKKLSSESDARLAQERESSRKEFESQEKRLEQVRAEHEKKLAAAHRKETEKLEQDFQAREKASLRVKEESLRKEFSVQLEEAIRRGEETVRSQSDERHRAEVLDVRKAMTAEFEKRLTAEQESWKKEFNAEKKALEEAFAQKRVAIAESHKKELEEQEKALRAAEELHFRQQQDVLRKELEAEWLRRFQAELEEQRKTFEASAAANLESEKEKLQRSYNELLEAQEERIRALRGTLQQEMEESFLRRMEQASKEFDYKMELLGTKIPAEAEEKHALYRKKMRELYQDGEPTVAAATDILALKEVLDLTFDDHLAIEADVRLELYTEAVERMIVGNEINLRDTSALKMVKEKFRITTEESARLEPYILSTIERLAVKGRILVADDDILLLQTLDDLLTDAGFQVIPAVSVNEALVQLNTTSVDIILSDIKFGESELDGFQFFAAVQSQPQMRKIPFIFMSSLRDGVIIRSGVQLGIDDYLTKPVEPDMLVAVIEGKLKRYRLFARN